MRSPYYKSKWMVSIQPYFVKTQWNTSLRAVKERGNPGVVEFIPSTLCMFIVPRNCLEKLTCGH